MVVEHRLTMARRGGEPAVRRGSENLRWRGGAERPAGGVAAQRGPTMDEVGAEEDGDMAGRAGGGPWPTREG